MASDDRLLMADAAFAAAMARLGPFEPKPLLAIAVSGGADSLALAVLADAWARSHGGAVVALVVDHGLRLASADEARATERLLTGRGIAVRVLQVAGLRHGTALAERARDARYTALIAACEAAGALHLLAGHHSADQAETVALRTLHGSFSAGLAGMAALVELPTVRLLRPLLGVSPGALRELLCANGIAWIEDPSNRDTHAQRVRLRLLAGDRDGAGPTSVARAAAVAGMAREVAETQAAQLLGCAASIRPEGFARIPARAIRPAALGALIQAIGGAPYPPTPDAVAALAAKPVPTTLGGVRLLPAGRLGPGLLLVREAAAMAPPVAARPGAVWDGRYRLARDATLPAGTTLGALGNDAGPLRERSALPAAVLRTLPALRSATALLAVPHLRYPDAAFCARIRVLFAPPRPAAGAPFRPIDLRTQPSLSARACGGRGSG
jgi:tRNA(Ile)-lysidine synthase